MLVTVFRVLTICILLAVIVTLPRVMYYTVKDGPMRWMFIISVDMAYTGGLVALVTHFNGQLVWYRGPLLFLAGSMALTFILRICHKQNHARKVLHQSKQELDSRATMST